MDTRKTSASERVRVGFLDHARAFAILSVIMVHSGSAAETVATRDGRTLIPAFILEITDLGRFGVQLFFLLSGILVAKLYEVNGTETSWKFKFAVRRFGRILPLWTAFLVFQIVLYLTPLRDWSSLRDLNTSESDTPLFLLSVALLTMTFTLWVLPEFWNTVIAGGWSIQVEVAHYVIFLFLNSKSLATWLRMLCLSQFLNLVAFFATLAPSPILKGGGEAILRLGICNSFIFFALGVIAVRMIEKRRVCASSQHFAKEMVLPALGALVCMVLTPGVFADTIVKLGFVLAALAASYLSSTIGMLQPILAAIAKYSYFMYFCHFWILATIFRIYEHYGQAVSLTPLTATISLAAVFGLTTVASLALGFLSFRLFERPSQDWINRQGARWANRNATQ